MATTSQPHSGDVIDLTGDKEFAMTMCGCMDDCMACVYGWFCGLCMMLDIQKSTHEVIICTPMPLLRQKIRHMRRIQGTGCGDMCAFMWCPPCIMCQSYHELKAANIFDPCCCGC